MNAINQEQMEVKVLEIRLMPPERPLKAFVDIKIRGLVIKDFRVLKEDGKRPYVKVPFVTYKDQTGQLKFKPIVVLPDEVRGEVDLAILNAYQREMELSDGKQKR